MPGVILAGISGAGKTSTYQRLLAVLAQRQQETLLAVPQAMTTTAHLNLAHDPAAQATAVLEWCADVIGRRAHPRPRSPRRADHAPPALDTAVRGRGVHL
jgi:hypothetical protein